MKVITKTYDLSEIYELDVDEEDFIEEQIAKQVRYIAEEAGYKWEDIIGHYSNISVDISLDIRDEKKKSNITT